jgi:hypothetical protein
MNPCPTSIFDVGPNVVTILLQLMTLGAAAYAASRTRGIVSALKANGASNANTTSSNPGPHA